MLNANRYSQKDEGPIDSQELSDGDTSFVGLNTRDNPDSLGAGVYQLGENVRITPNPVSNRKGLDKRTNSITFSSVVAVVGTAVVGTAVINDAPTDGILASCLFSDPTNHDAEYIALATQVKMYLYSAAGVVTSYNYPAGETCSVDDSVDMFQAGGNLYILRGELDGNIAVSGITRSGSTATVTCSSAHGLATGNWVRVSGANQTEYNGDFSITVTTSTAFTYSVTGSPATPATGTLVVHRIKTPLKWTGIAGSFSTMASGSAGGGRNYMPPSDFALLQANRAIYQYSRTSIAISDINNVELFDPVAGVLTFANGWSDYLTGLHPYQSNQTLVFLRRSIYLLNGIAGDVAEVTNQLLTAQVGCVSTGSIATCGSDVLFLSELGVFRLQPGIELNLRGNSEPLSAPIDPIIRRINFSAVGKAKAIYFNNRYYLAVPLDGETRNNAVLVFNFLTNSWESVDTYPTDFRIDFMEVMNVGNSPLLFFASQEGGLYAAELNDVDEYGAAGSDPSSLPIAMRFKTRRITYGSTNIKRFSRIVTNASLDANSSFTVTATLTNPDSTKVLASVASTTANSITRPAIISKRGYGIEIEYQNTSGTGRIINYTVSGAETGFKTVQST